MGRGETQMKRVRTLLVRAIVGALLLVALAGSVAYADDGIPGSGGVPAIPDLLPEDPGIA